MENIFLMACLVQLSTACWQGSKMLDPMLMEKVGDKEWLRGRKCLVNAERLNDIRAVVSRARKALQLSALPFPIKGLELVPKDAIDAVEAKLSEFRDEYWAAVERFLIGYEEEKDVAREKLGNLFNEADYPLNIRSKFGFEWRYITLQTPGKSNVLSPELYQREKEKFSEMMEETRQLAMAALRQEFADHVNHLVNRLTNNEDGTPKVFKSSMIEKMQGYLDSFDARNMFQDSALAELVEQAKELVGEVSASSLRDNAGLREQIRKAMESVRETMDSNIVDLPRRKIRFAA